MLTTLFRLIPIERSVIIYIFLFFFLSFFFLTTVGEYVARHLADEAFRCYAATGRKSG